MFCNHSLVGSLSVTQIWNKMGHGQNDKCLGGHKYIGDGYLEPQFSLIWNLDFNS